MTDYTKATGNGGTMLIRDTGSAVYFYIKSGSSSTWVNGAPFNWTVNGSSGNGTYNYPTGGAYALLRTVSVSTAQNVNFGIGASGTAGLGGPTEFTQWLPRGAAAPVTSADTVPPAPSYVRISDLTSNSMYVAFTSNGGGSAEFIRWELGWGTLANTPRTIITVDGSTSVNSLTTGTTYYFWARGVNAAGTGPWSVRSQATTLRVPDAPDPVVISAITQISLTTAFSANGNGGAAITKWELAYGTSSTAPQTFSNSTGTLNLVNLLPGTTYYFWARGFNSVGWGPYSARTTARTIAGARVLVGSVWKEAIPYVRVGGVWKIAQPWGKLAGVWKKTG